MIQTSSATQLKGGSSRDTRQPPGPTPSSVWRHALAWGIPSALAIFFLTLGFEAPPIDLFTRWMCVALAVALGRQLTRAPVPVAQSAPPQEDHLLDQLFAVHRELTSLHLPIVLQKFVDEMVKLIPCRSAALILLDRRQEEPEHVITHGEVPSSISSDFPTLLPKEIFLEVLERRIVVFNTPQELHDRLGALHRRVFAHHNLFVGCIRRHQHLAFLLLADRIGTEGFRPRDMQTFTAVMEAAAVAIENARLFDDVQVAEKKHRDLLHGIINAQEQESKLVAAEWQDRISKKLFTVLQGLRGFQSLILQRAPENGERFQQLTAEIDEIASLVRGLTNELHPSVLDDFGVAAAIREYVSDARTNPEERELLQVTVQTDEIDKQLPNEAKLLLFRITQEALRNIRKHADAKNVQIAFVQEHAGVSLMIKDDGKGFNPSQPRPGHFGLQYMRERAEACGGTFRVVSSQGEGTEVHINLPAITM